MKKLFYTGFLPVVILFIISCKGKPGHEKSFQEYRQFVMKHREKSSYYFDKPWADIAKEYSVRKSMAEKGSTRWNDSMKTEFFRLQSEWETFRVDFESEKVRQNSLEKVKSKVTTILPGNVDESLANVDTTNIVGVYRHLVAFIDQGGSDFTQQQWYQIENLWDRLANRYVQLETRLSRAEKAAIAEQKIRFDVIRAIHKPVTGMQDSS